MMQKKYAFYCLFLFIFTLDLVRSDHSAHADEYKKFYDVEIHVESMLRNPLEIPGLIHTTKLVETLPFATTDSQQGWISRMLPSGRHTYFKASADTDQSTLDALVAEYRRVKHTDDPDLVLYAVTNLQTYETILLPAYYELTDPDDQAAVLFEETYRLIYSPFDTHDKVLGASEAFRAVIREPSNSAHAIDFLEHVGHIRDFFIYAAKADIASGALKNLVFGDRHQMLLGSLLGEKFLNCITKNPNVERSGCLSFLTLHLTSLVREYPRSLFLQKLLIESGEKGDVIKDGLNFINIQASEERIKDMDYGFGYRYGIRHAGQVMAMPYSTRCSGPAAWSKLFPGCALEDFRSSPKDVTISLDPVQTSSDAYFQITDGWNRSLHEQSDGLFADKVIRRTRPSEHPDLYRYKLRLWEDWYNPAR